MALTVDNIKLNLNEDESSLTQKAAGILGVDAQDIAALRVVRMALDARRKQDIHHLCTVLVELTGGETRALSHAKSGHSVRRVTQNTPEEPRVGNAPLTAPVVVAGLGPAGLFAAYTLARYGYKPIVLERGRDGDRRASDVVRFMQSGVLDENSNVMFGEGGAGAFSDGKLTTRIKDVRANEVLRLLVHFGAPEEITVMAKPHIGTDKLCGVVKRMREEICALGGTVLFETQLCGLHTEDGRLTAVNVRNNGNVERLECTACVLATGQGARDTYSMLCANGMALAPKPFAVGVRIEHPRTAIDAAQFGAMAGHPRLGAAEYRLADSVNGRGVYTFCMCPGGVVIESACAQEELAVNGMSRHARNDENSNAAIVVQVAPCDFGEGPLDGMRFQQALEREAFRQGGGGYFAPAQRSADFMSGVNSGSLGSVSATHLPGVNVCSLDFLPDFVCAGVRGAITAFGHKLKGFDMGDAVITAVESRTSSPVRILRDADGSALNAKGLYPAGEGAGYAGGIVSAAVDGMHAAERIVELYAPPR